MSNDKAAGVSGLNEKEKALIKLLRNIKYGDVRIIVKDGIPIRAEQVTKSKGLVYFWEEKQMKKIISFLLAVSLILCTACGTASNGDDRKHNPYATGDGVNLPESSGYPMTIKDYFDVETTLEKMPEKVAVLSGSMLNVWYDLGGKSICSSDISDNIILTREYADEMLELPTVGPVYQVNMEAIVDTKPDLIITQAGVQTTATDQLGDMGIPVISLLMKTYEDTLDMYRLFGMILGQEELAEEKIAQIEEQVNSVVEKMPDENPSVVILYVTGQSLSVKLDDSIAGDIANMLGFTNIASDLPPDTIGSENTPLDIEYIVEKNPDYIFVTSMVSDNETAMATMTDEFENNPAWSGVGAVKSGNIIYLPQEYFLYNAGPYYGEAIEYMASSVYPEIFGAPEVG
jgi:iron complex transport system substrate-binding protein